MARFTPECPCACHAGAVVVHVVPCCGDAVAESVVTIERIQRARAAVSGVFSVTLAADWRERPLPETLEAEIAEAIRSVLQQHAEG